MEVHAFNASSVIMIQPLGASPWNSSGSYGINFKQTNLVMGSVQKQAAVPINIR